MFALTLETVTETFAIMFNAKTFSSFFLACLNTFFSILTLELRSRYLSSRHR